VVVASDAELQPVLDAVERTPLAAMALVQLLRHNAHLDAHEGLVAESLVYSTLQGGPEFAAWRARREKEAQRGHPAGRELGPRRGSARGPAVLTQRDGDCVHLTLNRPERHNAFSVEMRDALAEALQVVLCDPSIEEVVLSGAGPSFCSGGDLDEFGSFPDAATAHAIRSTRSPGRLLSACADRVRAELHGACVGAGIELPAFARRVAATEGAFFQLPEVGMGLVPGAGGTASIPRRIGRQRTAYLALSGRRLDAPTALEWGLVDELVAAHPPRAAAT
jgi:enoyl-CoA hydratase/carnithine racemase